jgi:hypothetical protein
MLLYSVVSSVLLIDINISITIDFASNFTYISYY